MKVFDISPWVSSKTAVFPGDESFQQRVIMDFPKDHLKLSSITTTVHIGAHADAPSHYSSKGSDIGSRDLSHYLGEAQVIHVKRPRGHRLYPEDLKTPIRAARVLFFTGSFPDPNQWNSDFNSLSPELIEFLAEKKVITVGIDTPSVDPADSKKLESHQAIAKHNLAILEGLVLEQIPEGIYELIALPLKLKGLDASPVRAILRKP